MRVPRQDTRTTQDAPSKHTLATLCDLFPTTSWLITDTENDFNPSSANPKHLGRRHVEQKDHSGGGKRKRAAFIHGRPNISRGRNQFR
jgi:hypothetical protein